MHTNRTLPIVMMACLAGVLLTAGTMAEADGTILRVGATQAYPFSDRYPAKVIFDEAAELALLVRLGIDISDVRREEVQRPQGPYRDYFDRMLAIAYVNDEEATLLEREGLVVVPIPNESLLAFQEYGPGSGGRNPWPTFEQYVGRMQSIAGAHPHLVRMVSIGQSVQGRPLWCLKITDNPDSEEEEPEFKYTSTMHGDETVGIELVLRLAELLVDNYQSDELGDPGLSAMVDEMEIWLCPIHNPDGYVAGSRYNANGIDLNRDFPDRITDPYDDLSDREPETQAFMQWGFHKRFVMGANYHGGAQVLNYPWDSVPEPPDYAPDDALFYEFGIGYASRNPMLESQQFPDGVTRGWEWYIARGAMQDWAYYWRGEHHVTIEVSTLKMPPYRKIDSYWDANREAMLWWMEQSLTGLHGLVLDATTGAPLDALIEILELEDLPNFARTDASLGDYHRVISPGEYTLRVSAPGYQSQEQWVDVSSGTATVEDFFLVPIEE